MSGLPAQADDRVNGVDVREQGSALRVATNTPHLVSLGTGRFSTAVTLHPIKQGRVTIGSDPTCDIYVQGTGVASVHCRVENSHGVVTLYPISGGTFLDGLPVDKPTRLSQGSMLTIGRSNYLRFNHPAEAELMKSVLPGARVSMAPIQFQPQDAYQDQIHCYQTQEQPQKIYKDPLSSLDQELDQSIREFGKKKPPAVPKKPTKDDYDTNDNERPKISSIMAKVSKFEYYAKQQKSVGKSQFYTHENEISPKVFSSNSLTVNTPAKDVLGNKNAPTNFKRNDTQKVIVLSENNSVDPKGCSYANVAIRNRNKIDSIVRNFDEKLNKLPKKINNDNVYQKLNNEKRQLDLGYGLRSPTLPSPAFDRNPEYSPVYANSSHERNLEAENRRMQAYQDRVKEEEQKQAENARLEEILNMCAEYERQISAGTPITPTEKKSQNKIITNGSLPRSVALTNPNFVQTSDGYYKFDTSHKHNGAMSRSLPIQRNVSSYENYDVTQISDNFDPKTPEFTIKHQSNTENSGRMDEIGIPVYENYKNDLSSPVMIRKISGDIKNSSPIGSPYENVYYKTNFKPNSPNTSSPRTRIKTTFAHKNLTSPQYFVFPTPPPVDKKPNFNVLLNSDKRNDLSSHEKANSPIATPDRVEKPVVILKVEKQDHHHPTTPPNVVKKQEIIVPDEKNLNILTKATIEVKSESNNNKKVTESPKFEGIEKQLSLEEDIPMIDDSNLNDDIEFRYSRNLESDELEITKNKSFEDVKKELMADIPELDEFEKDLKENRSKAVKNITKEVDIASSESSLSINDNVKELRERYESLKEERKKLVAEIHEIKCKMSEIRSQEDDILRELEMEKALIKGEYDSEIAILNIEQKKRKNLLERCKKIEEDIRSLKEKQEVRQNEMRDRVEIATGKVEKLEIDVKRDMATLEELQNAQDILDNETKIYEDLEFQHLEEESELLSNREDLQNEIAILTKKIESQKNRILTLKSEANENLTSALDETKILQSEYVKLLNNVEELTAKVQVVEKDLKPIVTKLNDIERAQSPDSAFFTNRGKSGDFGSTPQSSDSDDDVNKITESHTKHLRDKFNSIDQMSQSMMVDIERREITDLIEDVSIDRFSESPSKSSTSSKEKKGFWERNFDSLSRRKKKPKSPEKVDIMSQSLNENMFYNNENIEAEPNLDRFNSLRSSKKDKKVNNVVKSNSSSKIPTFAALGKIIKKDSFGKRKENELDDAKNNVKNRYIKNAKNQIDNKYKSKNPPEKIVEITELENDVYGKSNNTSNECDKRKNEFESGQLFRVLHRKSCGDEPGARSEAKKISDSGKIPSQDDIDRISKVTLDAPILSNDADMDTLGKKTVDSLKEIERKRMVMLEEQGCQVIENEREKISQLKQRVQNEAKQLWDQRLRDEGRSEGHCHSLDLGSLPDRTDLSGQDYSLGSAFDESSGLMSSSSIEELQVRNSRTESVEDEKRSDDSRPLSNASDFSRDNILSLQGYSSSRRRPRTLTSETQRPLTRYLPVDRDDFDLRLHLCSAGHQVDVCPHVTVTSSSCRGYLHKLGAKFHTWSKRWFVFDRDTKTFVYYWDKSERKPRGGAYFQVIEEVYLDHGNTSKSPSPQTTFIVKTRQRRYYLMAPSGESARIWIDVIFSGAQGYTEYLE